MVLVPTRLSWQVPVKPSTPDVMLERLGSTLVVWFVLLYDYS